MPVPGIALAAGLTASGAATAGGATAATAAGGTSFLQPWMVPLLTSGANALFRSLSPDRAMQIRDKVLNSQIETRNMIARRAFGHLTPAEAQSIEQGAEHQVNAVQANVASRGLGSSGAGAQVIADAQQQPFHEAQQQALNALPILDQALWQNTTALMLNDGSFTDDLQAVAQLITDEITADPEIANDPEIADMVRQIYLILQKPPGK